MPIRTHLEAASPSSAMKGASALVLVGRKAGLLSAAARALLPTGASAVWDALVDSASPGDLGASASTFVGSTGLRQVTACVLPEPCSRHNSPSRPHAITSLVGGAVGGKDDVAVICVVEDDAHALAAVAAVARTLPLYTRKGGEAGERTVRVALLGPGSAVTEGLDRLTRIGRAIREASALVDMPPCELNTDAFVAAARAAAPANTTVTVVRGEELDAAGYGGLWGVGKAAVVPPSLVILSYEPANPESTIALVGKGIVYDTGGLSIKGKDHMPGMKGDMGGAAAVLHAFVAAAELGCRSRVHALLCLAENAVGPESFRPDDILTMYSGKTVEVNNTDAEGRLVLADGVAHASRHLAPDVIIDMATLTGAQLMATGKRHAAIICNDEALEARCVAAGKATGDLVHALPYVPEFFRKEFKSEVADMKNSVKDRMNAQSSCAAQFVGEHLVDFAGAWLHIDIAGPSGNEKGRGTGFGVALLTELLGV